jgi:hypothetical protein
MEDVGAFFGLHVFYGHLVYFVAIWYILRPFGIFCSIWYILWPFGIFCGHLVYFVAIWYTVLRKIWQPLLYLHPRDFRGRGPEKAVFWQNIKSLLAISILYSLSLLATFHFSFFIFHFPL